MRLYVRLSEDKTTVINKAVFDDQGIPDDWEDKDLWIESTEAEIGHTYQKGKFIAPVEAKPELTQEEQERETKLLAQRKVFEDAGHSDPIDFLMAKVQELEAKLEELTKRL